MTTFKSPMKRFNEETCSSKSPVSETEILEDDKLYTQQEMNSLKNEMENLMPENIYLKEELEKLQKNMKQLYTFENISSNENMFKSETGLYLQSFESLFTFLNPGENCENIKFYDSKSKFSEESFISPSVKVKKQDQK